MPFDEYAFEKTAEVEAYWREGRSLKDALYRVTRGKFPKGPKLKAAAVAGKYDPAMQFREIGEAMGFSYQAAEQHYKSGMAKLRRSKELRLLAELCYSIKKPPTYEERMAQIDWGLDK